MSKFLIQWNYRKEAFRKGLPVYGTGNEYHKVEIDTLSEQLVAKDKVKYITGLTEEDLQNSPVLTQEEKSVYVKSLKEVQKKITNAFSKEALDPFNDYFWKSRKTFKINSESFNSIYDEENPNHLLLKYNILSGSFSSIAPNLDSALRTGRPFFMIEQTEADQKSYKDKAHFKIKAIGALNELEESGSIDALLYLSWVTLDTTQGYTRNTSKEVFLETMIDYIEGNLVKKDKKKCAQGFYENYLRWKNDKENLITEAIFKAGVHYGFVYFDKGKYVTKGKNTQLGSDEKESIEILLEGRNIPELKELKKAVEEKLNK